MPSTTTWYYKGEGRSVLNETGRYLVQWNLLDRKPDVNGGDTGLKVVGKLRLLVEVVDRFESDPETVTVGTFNEAWRLAVGDALLYDSEIPATSENKLVIQACLEKPEAGRLENIDNYGDLSEAYSFPAVKVRVGTPIGYQSGTTAFKLNLTTAVALDNILKTANNKGVTQSTGDDRLLNKAVSNNNLWLIGAESVFNRAGVYVCQWDLIDKNVTPSVVTGKLRIVVVAVEDGEF